MKADKFKIDLYQNSYGLAKDFIIVQSKLLSLMKLRVTGECTCILPEFLFDMETPDHYSRHFNFHLHPIFLRDLIKKTNHYVEIWEQEINGFQLPSELIESALGSPDTTTRIHRVYQTKTNIYLKSFFPSQKWGNQVNSLKEPLKSQTSRAFAANTVKLRRKGTVSLLEEIADDLSRWKDSADLGIALVELLASVADYLSCYQDMVATEAYLETARQKHSIRKYAICKLEQTIDAIITKYAISDSQSAYINCEETKQSVFSLFNLLPKIYQQQDEKRGGALKALLHVISEEFEILHQDIESLYKEWYIESADFWEVPFIGEGIIEDAFLRRMKFVIKFPFPSEEARLDIWKHVFPQISH